MCCPCSCSVAEKKPERKGVGDGGKERRKANYMKKILKDDKATKASSFLKRKPTLKKKAHELQTLCDVSICMVCYDSNGNVDTWPESRHDVVSVIHSYREVQKLEKRGSHVIGSLVSKKKKLAVKTEKNMKITCDEVAREFSKLFDGLTGDALEDSLKELDSRLKLMKERKEMLLIEITDRCESKITMSKLENVEPYPEVGLPAVMVDNKASPEVADILGSMSSPCDVPNSVLNLENFNPMVGFWGNMNLLPRNNSCFGHVSTSKLVMPEGYCVNYDLGWHPLTQSTYGPFCQASSSDVRMPGFSNLPLGSYINANMYNFAANKNGLLDHINGCSFGYGQDNSGFAPLCLAATTDAIHLPWPAWNARN